MASQRLHLCPKKGLEPECSIITEAGPQQALGARSGLFRRCWLLLLFLCVRTFVVTRELKVE